MKGTHAALCVLLLVTGACSSVRVGDLTIASTRLANVDGVDLDALPTTRRVEGYDKRWVLVFIPLGVPHLQDAIDEALDIGRGDVITDVSIHRGGWWFVIGQNWIKVTGDVVDTRQREGIVQ